MKYLSLLYVLSIYFHAYNSHFVETPEFNQNDPRYNYAQQQVGNPEMAQHELEYSLHLLNMVGNTVTRIDEYRYQYTGSRIYAIGDLHGDLANTRELLESAGLIDQNRRWTGENSLVVQVGDVFDRGPHGFKIFELLLDMGRQASEQGGGFMQIMGNHEFINLCGLYFYVSKDELNIYDKNLRTRMLAPGTHWGDYIRSLPPAIVINEFLFSHAGITQNISHLPLGSLAFYVWLGLKNNCEHFKHVQMSKVNLNRPHKAVYAVIGYEGPLWTRFYGGAAISYVCQQAAQVCRNYGVSHMLIGHTPTASKSIECRCTNMIIRLDTGISSYMLDSPNLLLIVVNQATDRLYTIRPYLRRK